LCRGAAQPLCLRIASGPKLASFCNMRVAVIYFSPRPLCRFDLAVKAISIRRRMEIGGALLT
jgi:hypothetical protein